MLFEEYQYYLNFKESGAMKMIVLSTLEGYLSIHGCTNCSKIYAPWSIAQLAHFKSFVKNGSFTYSNYLTLYSKSLQKEIKNILIHYNCLL